MLNDFSKMIESLMDKYFVQKMPKLLYKSIALYISKAGPNSLNNLSGNLLRSFKVGNRDNIFDYSISAEGLKMSYGSKVSYALIHEEGGTIHPKITEKSRKFFWAKWYETKQGKYKGMALTQKSNFDIKIKPKRYLTNGLRYFQNEYLPQLVNEFWQELSKNITGD